MPFEFQVQVIVIPELFRPLSRQRLASQIREEFLANPKPSCPSCPAISKPCDHSERNFANIEGALTNIRAR